jgi:hypothetical protein
MVPFYTVPELGKQEGLKEENVCLSDIRNFPGRTSGSEFGPQEQILYQELVGSYKKNNQKTNQHCIHFHLWPPFSWTGKGMEV